MNWFIYASSSVCFFVTLNLLQRKIAVGGKNHQAQAVVFNICAGLSAVALFVVTGAYRNFHLPTSIWAYVSLFIACIAYAFFEKGRFAAAKLLDSSRLTVISNVSAVVAFIGSLVIYSESMSVAKLIGAVLVMLALFLVSYEKTHKKSSLKGIVLGTLIFGVLGIGWMLDKKGALYFNPDSYNILLWTIPIILIALPKTKIKDMKAEWKLGSWKIALMAIINVIGYYLQLKALSLAEATRVFPIVQTTTIFTVLLGILILGERENVTRKIIAGALAIAGAYFLI